MNHEFLGGLSTAMKLMAFAPYIYSLYLGRTKPHFFTWLIWGLMMCIAFAIQVTEDAGPGAWITLASAMAYLGVAGYSLFQGEKN